MSNTKSRYAMRLAGGSKVFGHETDYGRILRLIDKVDDVGGNEGVESRILNFLEALEKNPSLANNYGLSKTDVAKLIATWGRNQQALGRSMTDAGRKKLQDVLNDFIG